MKKYKGLVSALTAITLTLSAMPLNANAAGIKPVTDFYLSSASICSYNQLAEMTDKQIIESYDYFFKDERFSDFGNDSVDDSVKFKKALSDCEYAAYENGCYSKLRLQLDYRFEPDNEATAEALGFPSDWQLTVNRGNFTIGEHSAKNGEKVKTVTGYFGYNEYDIKVPQEISRDFESYVRLLIAEHYIPYIYSNLSVIDVWEMADDMPPAINHGDVNFDGKTGIADSVLILQSIVNPDNYSFDNVYQKRLADVDGNDGITAGDALAIQEYEAGLLNTLTPPSYVSSVYFETNESDF